MFIPHPLFVEDSAKQTHVFYVSKILILGLMKVHVQFVLWEKLLEVAVLNSYFCLNVHFSNEHSRSFGKADRKKRKVTDQENAF